jgi:hypothetical protein
MKNLDKFVRLGLGFVYWVLFVCLFVCSASFKNFSNSCGMLHRKYPKWMGKPENLQLEDAPRPQILHGGILTRVLSVRAPTSGSVQTVQVGVPAWSSLVCFFH